MTSVAICSQKGGVGKTTVALNLAFSLASRGHRTLLADFDPLGSIGYSLSAEIAERPGLDVLVEDASKSPEDLLIATRLEELALLPAGGRAPEVFSRHSASLENGEFASRFFANDVVRGFDIVVCDTPSGIIGSSRGLVGNTSELIVVIQAEPIAARTLPRLAETFGRLADEGREIGVTGLLLTMTDHALPESGQIVEELSQALPEGLIFPHAIPRDSIFVAASARGVPVAMLSRPAPPAAYLFDQLASEFEQRAGLATATSHEEFVRLVD